VPYEPLPGTPGDALTPCSYAELDRRARAVAARLGGALRPGSRVLLVYEWGANLPGALYGCLYAGMVAVVAPPARAGRTVIAAAVARTAPAAVLTSGEGWSALPVDRDRTPVLEADGEFVDGLPVRQLAARWRPVGILRGANAYHRYVPSAGRVEEPLTHGDLLAVLRELHEARRLGASEDELGWIASVHGLDDTVWRVLLPVHEGRAVGGEGQRPAG
jgi:acyl-coenzyme A synthetase/AMP-(fatty) acid ligase